jgi:hypothetical protein
MTLVLIALGVGVVIGMLAGGSLHNLGRASFRLWPLLPVGVAVQFAADLARGRLSAALVVVSSALLVTFAAVNVHLVGMVLVLVGLSMNLGVIAANRGMPVRAEALVVAGIVERPELARLDLGSKRRLERPGDRLLPIADIIPVPAAREVVSFGDLILAIGAADVVAHMLRSRSRRREPVTPLVGNDATVGHLP